MYQRKTNRDVRKLKRQCNVRNVLKKRLPAIADRAVWEKKRASWNKVGLRRRKSMEEPKTKRKRGAISLHGQLWGYKTDIREGIKVTERLALRKKVNTLEIYGELNEEIGEQTCLHGAMD